MQILHRRKRAKELATYACSLAFANVRDDSTHGLGIVEDGGRFDRYGFHVRLDFQSMTLEGA